ncbi:copper resistance system multicopper oxidase [Candidatus Manganitrophus noduliformans]|uniref:Copper resistance system multicopper oxidase n=1 Tax=Candidatus Manganitrophus noduliformans TaxID=2606439 RepID=A0A7X6DU63_9BACT|nr:copper resistance system multicopper oxidase [Candidatus Manganitrophus noduliformans]NKE73409.1 copper resistance system multicopper oxidase [Candidatus Manganitrophus noduliformans]
MKTNRISRRQLLKRAGTLGMLAVLERLAPAYVWARPTEAAQTPQLSGKVIDLTIAETPFRIGDRTGTAHTINGTVPGPLLRLHEGEEVTLNVTNRLREIASIHWHGILLPPEMDGVPGVSFGGIKPGTTFTYRFPLKQSGTYWYHSHSGFQEQLGVYAPMIIDPVEPDPVQYDRDYVVVLSDWMFEDPMKMMGKLKKQAGYTNFQKRTMREFLSEAKKNGWRTTFDDYRMWAQMRMDPTDLADITGHTYTYLMNGRSPASNWTGLFRPGERVRLRFINAAAMSIFDVRIPGLKMTVVQADGQNVQPVDVDEFRIAVAETYDLIVEPKEDRAYTIFAESIDRSGYARGTLAPRAGMSADIPKGRPRPLRTMEEMGMSMEGMDHGKMKMPEMKPSDDEQMGNMQHGAEMEEMPGMEHGEGMEGMPDKKEEHDMQDMEGMPGMPMDNQRRSEIPGSTPVKHGPDTHGSGNQATPDVTRSRLEEPGAGLGNDGWRVLVYTDLKSLHPYPDRRAPERELELHITGHMERFIWSFDGKKFSEAKEPIHFRYGERLRWTFVNDTMMEHPLHLHGMFMELENGAGPNLPRKHTVNVKPAERVSVAITADAPGPWAFHCHLLFHMEAGMFRVVEVSEPEVRS